jgi:hypothetical protein
MRVLMAIVVGLPLLMPPGVCICQYLPCAHATPPEVRTAGTAACETEKPSSCACLRHRTHGTRVNEHGDASAAAAAVADRETTCPGRHEHSPGCPVVANAHKVLPGASPRLLAFAFASAELPAVIDLRSEGVKRAGATSVQPVGSPIYLTFCALLI